MSPAAFFVIPFQQNCSLIVCQRTKAAALVDPGGKGERLLAVVARHAGEILVAHGHLDHRCGVAKLQQRLGVPLSASR